MPENKSRKSSADRSLRQRRVYSIVFVGLSVIMILSMVLMMISN